MYVTNMRLLDRFTYKQPKNIRYIYIAIPLDLTLIYDITAYQNRLVQRVK